MLLQALELKPETRGRNRAPLHAWTSSASLQTRRAAAAPSTRLADGWGEHSLGMVPNMRPTRTMHRGLVLQPVAKQPLGYRRGTQL